MNNKKRAPGCLGYIKLFTPENHAASAAGDQAIASETYHAVLLKPLHLSSSLNWTCRTSAAMNQPAFADRSTVQLFAYEATSEGFTYIARHLHIPWKSKDQTLPIGSRESFTWIILKTILCLVLDFQGIYNIYHYI